MQINTNQIVSISEANQNFSRVAREADRMGSVVIFKNNKPKFKFSDIQFNITHSNQFVMAAFDKYPVGIDLEYMKDRNFTEISKHYNLNTDNKTEFYKKWTQLEATIKIQADSKQTYTEKFESNYMLTIVSTNPEKINPEIKTYNIFDKESLESTVSALKNEMSFV